MKPPIHGMTSAWSLVIGAVIACLAHGNWAIVYGMTPVAIAWTIIVVSMWGRR